MDQGILVDSNSIYNAAESLKKSANKIDGLLGDFEDLIQQVSNNYASETSTKVQNSFNKVKENGPEFKKAIDECSKYLSETVAPSYEKVENDAAEVVS